MMKILTVNCVYNTGSTGKIILDTAEVLKDRCAFDFCYETGPKCENGAYRIASHFEQLFYYVFARLTGLKYGTGYTTTLRLLKHLKRFDPDIVHIHCPNVHTVNLFWLISYLKKHKIPTVITNHAEFFYTGNCPHAYDCTKYQTGCGKCSIIFDPYRKYLFDRTTYEWRKMKTALTGFVSVQMVAVSPWQKSRMLTSPLFDGQNPVVVMNGLDTKDYFCHRENSIRKELGLSEEHKIVLHVTVSFTNESNDLKGGRFILQLAKLNPDIKFVIVGPSLVPDISVYGENLIFIGPVHDRIKLSEYYSMADLTVITSRCETFSMVCAESLSCGTPIVGFKAGGPETISLLSYSEFVEYGDISALDCCINRWIAKKTTFGSAISTDAGKVYSKERMANEYYLIYKELYEAKKAEGR